MDIAQLANSIQDSSANSGSEVDAPLSDDVVAGIRSLFSSAPTLVLSLAHSHESDVLPEQPSQQQPPQHHQQRVNLSWEAVNQLGSILDGSHSRYTSSCTWHAAAHDCWSAIDNILCHPTSCQNCWVCD